MSDDCSRPITAPPEAFIGMLSSKDFGKLVMKAADVDHQHSPLADAARPSVGTHLHTVCLT
jgi:hypothetical protein